MRLRNNMSYYLTITDEDKRLMLQTVGVGDVGELFCDIPKKYRISELKLPNGKSQQEVYEQVLALSRKNKRYDAVFTGAGSYTHYIPSVVKNLSSRSEFVTSYTPYQAELSQGILQAIFEYQTMICALTGMDVSNASHYSGAAAAAEACIMCAEKKKRIITFDNINPDTLEVLRTYLGARDIRLDVLGSVRGRAVLDGDTEDVGGVYLETPNYYGIIEDAEVIAQITHKAGGKLIISSNPIALGLIKSQREQGADIAVGEAQPLGLSVNFGGPYLGYMAATTKEARRLPGRIVGETTDKNGERAYVLTLQAREQHIRREKATSNICSNEALCALTASIYLSAAGADGLREVASACVSNAHYLAQKLVAAGAELKYGAEFFHEFVTVTPHKAKALSIALDRAGIMGGLVLNEHETLWCATETSAKRAMDKVAQIAEEII